MSVQTIRRRKPILKTLEDLDAFSKIPDTCVQTTSYGGSASIVSLIIIGWLVILETSYFLDTDYKFRFTTDNQIDDKLSINIDLVVAMPCGSVGADIIDNTNQNVWKFGELEEEFAHFELTEQQKQYFNAKSSLNSYLREQYHSLSKLLWKSDFKNLYSEMPQMSKEEKRQRGLARACRLHGKLTINKLAGNFHITAGKTLPLPRGHAHIAAFMSDSDYNFTHRIYKFSFGEHDSPSIVHPLEGDEKIAQKNHMLYQYFIQVVPTTVKTRFRTYQTFQYSVRELEREIDHDKNSHGISGIFFKYDMSGFKVEVTEESYPIWQFLVRICAIIGGVYATIGMLYNHLSFLSCQVRSFVQEESKTKDKHSKFYGSNTESKSNKKEPLQHNYSNFQTPVVDLIHQDPPLIYENVIQQNEDSPLLQQKSQDENKVLPDLLASHSL